jgi:PiT family inorganic phosphate transporter
MGVFVSVSPFQTIRLTDDILVSSAQQLFLIGGLAIAIGVFTYSKRVMLTVGSELMRLTPLAAWVAVMAHSIVLFLFASEQLEQWLAHLHLPTIPLVPVSSSQAVVGAVIGIGMVQGGRELHWNRLFSITKGWFLTPIFSGLICFIGLFFLQNVFHQAVKSETKYLLSDSVIEKLNKSEIKLPSMKELQNTSYPTSGELTRALKNLGTLSNNQALKAIEYAELKPILVDPAQLNRIDRSLFTQNQMKTLIELKGQSFNHIWKFNDSLMESSEEWHIQGGLENKLSDRHTLQKLSYLHRHFFK